jgi:hypothetical protein
MLQEEDHVMILHEEKQVVMDDVHAPAKTYYTTGNNAGNVINRLRTLSVCTPHNKYLLLHKYS